MVVLGCVGLGWVAMAVAVTRAGRARRASLVVAALALGGVGALLVGSFEAQKILGRLVMPAGLLAQLLLFGLALDVLDRRALRAAVSALGLGLLVGSASLAMGTALIGELEAEVPDDPGGSFDAVFVLGGGTAQAPDGSPELGAAGDRVRLGAALFHRGRTPVLIASGRTHDALGERNLAAETRDLWTEMGIPASAVRTLPEPVNTRTEVAAYAALSQAEGWTRIGLVSSAAHLPRVAAQAERVGLEGAVLLAADHRRGAGRRPSALWWIPSGGGLRLTDAWAWERLGRWLGR